MYNPHPFSLCMQEKQEKQLKKKPKLAFLVSTVRDRLEILRRRMRSCRRCALGQSILLKSIHSILMIMLGNTFDTLDGPCVITHNQAGWFNICV